MRRRAGKQVSDPVDDHSTRSLTCCVKGEPELPPCEPHRHNRRCSAPATPAPLLSLIDSSRPDDVDALDDTIGRGIITARPSTNSGRRVYSVDGKMLRGSGPAGSQVHLLAVLDQHTGIVLGQVNVDGKTNELTRIRLLLEALDLTGVTVTAVALHTQREHARWLAKPSRPVTCSP